MKIIHTSDWHIGRSLYGRKRYDEFKQFLDWMANTIEANAIDVLLIAGDIFDTTSPSNKAQELYYQFLCRVSASCCRHVVVTAGNHDSPSFISAPKEVLQFLNVHVVGAAPDDPAECVISLEGSDGQTELIVCAVPYLRDRDVRRTEAGETIDDKRRKLMEGITTYYAGAVEQAVKLKEAAGTQPPIVAMGHLFTAGGKTVDGDGVRELYVGSLAHVESSTFPEAIDYLALGHLHVPQTIGGNKTRRYSGSPLPIGFGEAKQTKGVCLVDITDSTPSVTLIDVDRFRQLKSITGDWPTLTRIITEMALANEPVWLEVEYTGADLIPDLRSRMDEIVGEAPVEILRIRNKRIMDRVLKQNMPEESLEDLEHADVFDRCMDENDIPADDRVELQALYSLVVNSMHERDEKAE